MSDQNNGNWLIRCKSNDQVRGFVVGDKTTVAISSDEEFVAIDQPVDLDGRIIYYRYNNGNYTYEPLFEQEHYNRVWQRIRAKSYPPLTDFVDAWVKQDDVALEAYRQACLDVKLKYPKPE